jgi:hypothetical protein
MEKHGVKKYLAFRSKMSGFKTRLAAFFENFQAKKAVQYALRQLCGSVRRSMPNRVICRGRAVKRRHGAVCGLYGHCVVYVVISTYTSSG